ncbi:apicoplast import protein [Babesia ovata]|uniref:Apicoplast import protein n=1 Tax=Babesia ovata TaxID=189622 RepID=A0A2H6K884_9APIC|nr:apicoplast import protein [Babesia ovata]GBE59201.1 apicoplast import protein [Babesia ovata]
MLFRLLYTAVLVARWSVFASAGPAARPFRAFVETLSRRSSNALYETLSQGSYASPAECVAASAAYVLPLMDAVENFGEAVKPHVPPLAQDALQSIHKLSQFYSQVPFLSYTMSTLIYSGLVKKNQLKTSYFVRYHFLQSLILSSFQNALAMFYFKLLPIDASSQDFVSVVSLMSAVISSFGAVFYCVFHAILGRFAALPIISDAVQLHIGEIPSNEILKRRITDTDSVAAMR